MSWPVETKARWDLDFDRICRRENGFRLDRFYDYDLDPGLIAKPGWVSDRRFFNGVDPEVALANLPLEDLFDIFSNLASIWDSAGRHDMYEVLIHLMFPAKEHGFIATIALWMLRDRKSNNFIVKILNDNREDKVSIGAVKKLREYIEDRAVSFCNRIKLVPKIGNFLRKNIDSFQDEYLEEEAGVV